MVASVAVLVVLELGEVPPSTAIDAIVGVVAIGMIDGVEAVVLVTVGLGILDLKKGV